MAFSHTKEEADSLYKQSKFAEAINVYNRVIEAKNKATAVGRREDLHILHSNRCACYLQVGDILKALEDANSCVRLNPGWCKGYNRKGACLLRLSLRDEAILSYEKVLELDASNADAISALTKLRGSTARSAGSSQFPNSLLNYWNVFTFTATQYSKDGYAYLKSFLDILRKFMRQCYYSVLTWWFSLGDLTKNFMYLLAVIAAASLYWLFFHKKDSYHRYYPDGSNLYGSHHSNSVGHAHGSYKRGDYKGSYHYSSYGGGYDFSNGNNRSGDISLTIMVMMMLGAWKLPPMFPYLLGDYARPFFGMSSWTYFFLLPR